MRRRPILGGLLGAVGCALAAGNVGCAGALHALAAASAASQELSSAIDLAEAGSEAYFARHPRQEDQDKVKMALRVAREAQLALDAVLRTAKDIAAEDLSQARQSALEAYTKLYQLLSTLGILDGTSQGGAETTAPEPGELVLPLPQDLHL